MTEIIRPAFFNDPLKVEDLGAALHRWHGTPFMAHVRVCGVGCSCETFPLQVYKEVGHLPPDFEIPEGTIRHFRTARGAGLMAPFLDQARQFELQRALPDMTQPGDLLGFTVGRIVHHLGIAWTGGKFIHCLDPGGVQWSSLRDATFLKRFARIWRPVT